MTNRQLQGVIFKHQGTSYLVLQDNKWDSEHLNVRSIDPSRVMSQMPRKVIENHCRTQGDSAEDFAEK